MAYIIDGQLGRRRVLLDVRYAQIATKVRSAAK
jgi:hypothetical protein